MPDCPVFGLRREWREQWANLVLAATGSRYPAPRGSPPRHSLPRGSRREVRKELRAGRNPMRSPRTNCRCCEKDPRRGTSTRVERRKEGCRRRKQCRCEDRYPTDRRWDRCVGPEWWRWREGWCHIPGWFVADSPGWSWQLFSNCPIPILSVGSSSRSWQIDQTWMESELGCHVCYMLKENAAIVSAKNLCDSSA